MPQKKKVNKKEYDVIINKSNILIIDYIIILFAPRQPAGDNGGSGCRREPASGSLLEVFSI